MRILHCTDFHANTHWFDWLVDTAPTFDLVCFTGDLLDILAPSGIDRQLVTAAAGIARISVPVAICSGNHDLLPRLPPLLHHKWMANLRRQNVWLDGDQFQISGQRFRCVGWNGKHPCRHNEEVWLHHAPPGGSLVSCDAEGGDAGDDILQDLCLRDLGPAIVLSGHQHHPVEWECRVGLTRCFNPGYNMRATVPNHIVIDTVKRTAVLRVHGADTRLTKI